MSVFFTNGEPATRTKMNKMSVRKGTLEEIKADPDTGVIWYVTDHHVHVTKQADGIHIIGDNNTGSIEIFAGVSDWIPGGWLLCDGRELDRDEYKGLFDVIGTTYGEGDGSETFNIPDMVTDGKFAYHGEGTYVGENEVTLTEAELPSHTHTFDRRSAGSSSGTSSTSYSTSLSYTGSIGGDEPHENIPPFIRMRYIIKA